jgi:hypothetical protein
MRNFAIAALAAFTLTMALPGGASAATCVNGVYRAGCAGPNGAVGVRKAPYRYVRPHAYYAAPHRHTTVHCANGVYRAGCVSSNGGAVGVRKGY